MTRDMRSEGARELRLRFADRVQAHIDRDGIGIIVFQHPLGLNAYHASDVRLDMRFEIKPWQWKRPADVARRIKLAWIQKLIAGDA